MTPRELRAIEARIDAMRAERCAMVPTYMFGFVDERSGEVVTNRARDMERNLVACKALIAEGASPTVVARTLGITRSRAILLIKKSGITPTYRRRNRRPT